MLATLLRLETTVKVVGGLRDVLLSPSTCPSTWHSVEHHARRAGSCCAKLVQSSAHPAPQDRRGNIRAEMGAHHEAAFWACLVDQESRCEALLDRWCIILGSRGVALDPIVGSPNFQGLCGSFVLAVDLRDW